jgi:hypothetical protein
MGFDSPSRHHLVNKLLLLYSTRTATEKCTANPPAQPTNARPRVLSRRLAEISTGSFTAPDVARIRISELAENFLRDYRINGLSSIDDAEARWRLHIEPFFGSPRVSAVTSDLLDRYVDRRQQQGAKNATINRELAALKRMFHLGHLWCKDPLSRARSQGRTD